MYGIEVIEWHPAAVIPVEHGKRCIVHALNQWFITAVWDHDTQQFWDKDGQPVAAVIEWAYRPDRDEA